MTNLTNNTAPYKQEVRRGKGFCSGGGLLEVESGLGYLSPSLLWESEANFVSDIKRMSVFGRGIPNNLLSANLCESHG